MPVDWGGQRAQWFANLNVAVCGRRPFWCKIERIPSDYLFVREQFHWDARQGGLDEKTGN